MCYKILPMSESYGKAGCYPEESCQFSELNLNLDVPVQITRVKRGYLSVQAGHLETGRERWRFLVAAHTLRSWSRSAASWRSRTAAARPDGPAPTITTSNSMDSRSTAASSILPCPFRRRPARPAHQRPAAGPSPARRTARGDYTVLNRNPPLTLRPAPT